MSRYTLNVNGRDRTVDVDSDTPLLYALRDGLKLANPRFGCGLGQCGACTVLLDDQPVRSCVTPVTRAAGKHVVTIEGLGTPDRPHPLQAAFVEEQATQCGYCVNGWLLTAKALLDANPHPTDEQIRAGLNGLICRCGSHSAIMEAVRRASNAPIRKERA